MFRYSALRWQSKFRKQGDRIDLKTEFRKVKVYAKAKRLTTVDSASGEKLLGRGKQRTKQQDPLKAALEKMETPAIWIWYPWRQNPEPCQPFMPEIRAKKNLHGAVVTGMTEKHKERQTEMMSPDGVRIPGTRDAIFQSQHPYLANVLKSLEGKPKGFPFWYKRYPTRRHAYHNRFSIPDEMLDGYSETVKKCLSRSMMTIREREAFQRSIYMEKYAENDLDRSSPVLQCTIAALKVRTMRSELFQNPHNMLLKKALCRTEIKLERNLRMLRKIDFKKYWEIIRDHDVQDIIQPANSVIYRRGDYWKFDWNFGYAINTNISDFMDPRGLTGCVETGRSRSEVARDLGLCVTRVLNDRERSVMSSTAQYHEKMAKFKNDFPEESRKRDRDKFLSKFTGMFAIANGRNAVIDFPSTHRRLVGRKILRWKSSRHGPM